MTRHPESGRGAPGPARTGAPPGAAAGDPRALIPALPSATISRPSLHRRLDEALGGRLTVVTAGAGWGKTTAVADWLSVRADRGPRVVWLTLDRGSDDPARFWEAVLGALRTSRAVAADDPLAVLTIAGGLTDDLVVAIHQRLRGLPEPVLLVLDDFHLIEHPLVLDAVATMVERATRLRVVVLTRVDPLLPVHRLRLSGDLAEITSADLAFDSAEIAALARSSGLALSDPQIEEVLARTEGWPAGVRLATMYLSRVGTETGVRGFAGTERSVAEYLVAEVLSRNPLEVRRFLLLTSVAGRICADLAAELAPGPPAQSLLEMLEGRNEFVTALGHDRYWFRYHPLLRELLEHSLKRDDPGAYRDAHRVAAGWLANHGEPIAALGHARAASDWDLFASVYFAAAGPCLVGRDRGDLERQLLEVPYAQLPESVEVHLMQAGLGLLLGSLGAVREHVARARRLMLDCVVPLPEGAEALLELLTCAALRATGDGRGTVRASAAAMGALDRSGGFPAMAGYRVIAANNRGTGLLWSGDVVGAREWLSRAAEASAACGVEVVRISAQAHLAFCDLVDGDLDTAEAAADETLRAAAARGWCGLLQVRPAHVVIARTRLLRGDTDRCDPAVAAGLAAVIGGTEPAATLALRITQGWVAVSRGRHRAARMAGTAAKQAAEGWAVPGYLCDDLRHLLTDVAVLTDDLDVAAGNLGESCSRRDESPAQVACRARLLLVAKDPRAAQDIAASLTSNAEIATTADLIAVVDAWLVQALAADSRGHQLAATKALVGALELAEPHRLVRPFLVTGSSRTAELLRILTDRQAKRGAFSLDLLHRMGGADPGLPEPEPLIEALTQRELAILAELPTMKSNGQIANDFYVSVNTVKTHLRSLYRKLGVRTRRQAVLRANELGLLT